MLEVFCVSVVILKIWRTHILAKFWAVVGMYVELPIKIHHENIDYQSTHGITAFIFNTHSLQSAWQKQ